MTQPIPAEIDVTTLTDKDLEQQKAQLVKTLETETDPTRIAEMTAKRDRLAVEKGAREERAHEAAHEAYYAARGLETPAKAKVKADADLRKLVKELVDEAVEKAMKAK